MKKPADNLQYLSKFILPSEKLLDYVKRSATTTNNIMEGSWRSSKSVTNIMALAINLELSPDTLHLAIGFSSSSAQEIIFENDGLGLKYWPDWQEKTVKQGDRYIKMPQRIFEGKYKEHNALILLPRVGTNHPTKYIVALGGGLENSYKAFRGWGVGMVAATEIDQLHEKTMLELKGRTIASKHRRNFWDFNPTDPRNYIYSEYVDFYREHNAENTNYLHTTMDDNPVLDEERKIELKGEYPPGSVQYRRYILGERVVAENLIYVVEDEKNIIAEYNQQNYAKYIIIADPGENSSATAFGTEAITRDYRYIDTLHEYDHRNADNVNAGIKSPHEYAVDFCKFIIGVCDDMKFKPYAVISDDDITFKREFDRIKHTYGLGWVHLESPLKEEINDRIKTGVNLLWLGRKRFYKECKKTIQSYKEAQYDPKEAARGKFVRLDEPTKGTMIDQIDKSEYGITKLKYEISLYKGV